MKKTLYIALLLLSVSLTAQITVRKKLKITDTPNTALPSEFLVKTTGDHLVKATTFSQLVALMQSNLTFTTNTNTQLSQSQVGGFATSEGFAKTFLNNNFSASQTFAQDVTIQGNLFVNGGTTTINSQITSTDSVIDMNSGEVGNGVTSGFSGLNINRGSSTSFAFGFDEIRDSFVLGKVTDLSAVNVATMQDVATRSGLGSWTSGNLPFWNAANKRFEDSGLFASSIWHSGNFIPGTDYQVPLSNVAFTIGNQTFTGLKTFDTNSSNALVLSRSSVSNVNIKMINPSTTSYLGIGTSNDLMWGTNSTATLNDKIYHAGNLNKSDVDFAAKDITASKLDVNSGVINEVALFESTDATAIINIKDTSSSSYFGTSGGKTFIGTAAGLSATNLNVLSDGKVGIGTTSPSYPLNVESTEQYLIGWRRSAISDEWALGADSGGTYFSDRDGVGIVQYWTESGDIGIGENSPNGRLHIKETSEAWFDLDGTDSALIFNSAVSNSWRIGVKESDDSFRIAQDDISLNTNPRLILTSTEATFSGTATATNFIIGSDIRLKTNILPISQEEIQINYKQFERKDNLGQIRYGVIAQELELGNPELVYTDKKGEKSVAYIDLLIREIAFLKAQNEIKNKQIKDILTALSKKQDIPYFGLTPINTESQYKTRLKKRALNLRKQF